MSKRNEKKISRKNHKGIMISDARIISIFDETTDRFQHAIAQVEQAIPGVPISKHAGVDVRDTSDIWNAGEYGCAMAHQNAIKSIASEKHEDDLSFSCVFEDDVTFTNRNTVFELLEKHPMPSDANILQLGFRLRPELSDPDHEIGYNKDLRIACHAYCINGRGARLLDDHLNNAWPQTCPVKKFSGPPVDLAWVGAPNSYSLRDDDTTIELKNDFMNGSGIFSQKRDNKVWKSSIQGRRI